MTREPRPQVQSRSNTIALLKAARHGGWAMARFERRYDAMLGDETSMDPSCVCVFVRGVGGHA